MIKKILVAVDGSRPARKALDWAINFAKCFESNLTILHVLSNQSLTEGERKLVESEYQVQIQEALRGSAARKSTKVGDLLGSGTSIDVAVRTAMGRAMLNRAKETANEKGLSSVRTVLTDGDPASTILEQANKGALIW